ncbi:hypothetical protein PROSTU_02162 [Providencia stuartii ATCC 25827]|uniref:Uncharacterized protein n=1 Tax=Providencia stuartii ATCC 25827 TaxID=471874 RepID=A0AA86YIK8_PROST|nr:hypothetical protein PROSTU_02162 [Providencia stuartii ATCC 25827]
MSRTQYHGLSASKISHPQCGKNNDHLLKRLIDKISMSKFDL